MVMVMMMMMMMVLARPKVTRKGQLEATPTIETWVLAIGSAGFVIGIVLLGSRTIATVGGKITKLTPSRSFAVQECLITNYYH